MKRLSLSCCALSVCATLLLAGCESHSSGSAALPQSVVQPAGGVQPALKPCPTAACIYVANNSPSGPAGSILVYPADATGNVSPYREIAGTQTGLGTLAGVAVDSRGKVYVSIFSQGSNGGSISVFDARANGDAKPLRTIQGPATRLNVANGIALSGGKVYANNFHDTHHCRAFNGCLARGYVTEYPSGSSGNAAPTRIIRGERTGRWAMVSQDVAVDGHGNVYVANRRACLYYYCLGKTGILVYEPGVRGRSAPSWTIGGSKTQLQFPDSVAVDGAGNIYVSDYGTNSHTHIFVYEAGQHGNVAPVQDISGPNTRLYFPIAIAVDAERNIYVANEAISGNGGIFVYAAGATGNVAPIQLITGLKTGLTSPLGIAVH